jgi:diaminopimelate epimerase
VRFSKWHALGNSYVVVEQSDSGTSLTAGLARRLCDRATGVGADGVLEVLDRTSTSVEILIWNSDGSTAEMSGNGTRIAAAWLSAASGASEVEISVGGRVVAVRSRADGLLEQDLGPVSVGARETLELQGNLVEVVPVDVGNQHAVVPCVEPTREVLGRLGPLVEMHQRFPRRTNVQLAHADGRHDVRALVWERGAGETPASGSSAVAVAAAAVQEGWCESPISVHMPGGTLEVRLDRGHATLVGPVEEICHGDFVAAGSSLQAGSG